MAAMVNNGTESRGPDMGKAQLSLLSWLEPVVCDGRQLSKATGNTNVIADHS